MEGKYKYRNGEPARVLCVDGGDEYHPVISITKNGVVVSHSITGNFFNPSKQEHEFDLIIHIPLWEGEIWVKGNSVLNSNSGYTNFSKQSLGYRKIKVKEIE